VAVAVILCPADTAFVGEKVTLPLALVCTFLCPKKVESFSVLAPSSVLFCRAILTWRLRDH
jgi:hypothetical protein